MASSNGITANSASGDAPKDPYQEKATAISADQKSTTSETSQSGNAILRPYRLKLGEARELICRDETKLIMAIVRQSARFGDVDALIAFWSANLSVLAELWLRNEGGDDGPVPKFIATLKARLTQNATAALPNDWQPKQAHPALPKEKRVRDRQHLVFVANHPCLVCGRVPAQAHHLKFAQPRAMGMKVSDEYTVPLCNIHHDALHRTGDERAWWARHGIIEPLRYAAELWEASRQANSTGNRSGRPAETEQD